MIKVPMTVQGEVKLRKELERLKREERPRIVKAIEEARAHGDLKENAEYHAAKEQQGLTEARIRDIESKLAHVQIIDVTKMSGSKDKVVFGATVHLYDVVNDKRIIYQIVGDEETDIKNGRISVNSPVARALIGKKIDDEVTVKTPSGDAVYVVEEIEYI